MKVRVLFEVRRFEIVGPEDQDLAFSEFGMLFFDQDHAREAVVISKKLFFFRMVRRLAQFSNFFIHFDHGVSRYLRRVVGIDPAGDIAMRVHGFD